MDAEQRTAAFFKHRDRSKIIVWAGAGISIPAPTCLPAAEPLVWHWLEHLAGAECVTILKKLYGNHGQTLGKPFPRLEKIIEDAVQSHGEEVLSLLEFIKNRLPNSNHKLIANHIEKHHGLAVTTNFDTAIEDAARQVISVATYLKSPDAETRLFKLHGCISEDKVQLGHSISRLALGLAPHFKTCFDQLFLDPARTILVFGYSGSDVFDVTPYFSSRSEEKFAAHLVWICHSNFETREISLSQAFEEGLLSEGARTMAEAFEHSRFIVGDTTKFINIALSPDSCFADESPEVEAWQNGWNDVYSPTRFAKYAYAARIFASLGWGVKSLEFIEKAFSAQTAPYQKSKFLAGLYLNALRDCGAYSRENLLRVADRKTGEKQTPINWIDIRQLANSYRLSGRPVRAFLTFRRNLKRIFCDRSHESAATELQKSMFVTDYGLFLKGIVEWMSLLPFPLSVLSKPVRSLIINEIRRLADAAMINFPAGRADPHTDAASGRLRRFSFFSNTAVSIRYLSSLATNHYSVEEANGLTSAVEPSSIYLETDSILGRVNALRDEAWGFYQLATSPAVGMDKQKVSVTKVAVGLQQSSIELATLIDDLPGQIKGYFRLVEYYRFIGKDKLSKNCQLEAKRLKSVLRRNLHIKKYDIDTIEKRLF